MPVTARLDWICRQLEMGRKGHLSVGEARDAGRLKVKVILQPADAGAIDPAVSRGLIMSLSFLRQLLSQHVSVDRGHKHSTGAAEVCFWINFAVNDVVLSDNLRADAAVFEPTVEVQQAPDEDCSLKQPDRGTEELDQGEEEPARSGVHVADEDISVNNVQRGSSSSDFPDQGAGSSDRVKVQVAHSLPDSVYAFSCAFCVRKDATFGDVLRNLHARSNAWSGWSINNVEGDGDISHIGLVSQQRLKSSLSNEEKKHLLSAALPIGRQRSFTVGGSGAQLTNRTDVEIEIIVKQMREAHLSRLQDTLQEPLGEHTQAQMGGYEKLVLKVREMNKSVAE